MKTNKNVEKISVHIKRLIIITFFIILSVGLYCYKTIYERNELDVWTGQYVFSDAFEHNSGEINYCVDYEIIIYRDNEKYYVELEGNGWFLQTRSLAYVEGNKNSIDIIFKSTLPGDSSYGSVERYETDELMLTLSYDDSELISIWHVLRKEHPIFYENTEEIKGSYFEKIV